MPLSSQKWLHNLTPRKELQAFAGQASYNCDDIVLMPNVTINVSGIGLNLTPEQYMVQVCPSSQGLTSAIQICKASFLTH